MLLTRISELSSVGLGDTGILVIEDAGLAAERETREDLLCDFASELSVGTVTKCSGDLTDDFADGEFFDAKLEGTVTAKVSFDAFTEDFTDWKLKSRAGAFIYG